MSIQILPYELLSAILEDVASLNARDNSQYTYGIDSSGLGGPLVVRGQLASDALKWNMTAAIRQVNRQWHDWACEYALKALYITRWRGSERWIQSRELSKIGEKASNIAVYRDPYHSLRKSSELFSSSPALASCLRRVWFNGYYGAETNALIFSIIRRCNTLECLTLPWTALRYGTIEDWSHLLAGNQRGQGLSSLEFLAVDLKELHIANMVNQVDNKALESSLVNFRGLERLKIFGKSNFMTLTDNDLFAMARTAENLQDLHVTGTTASITIKGIMALVKASRATLQMLEHSPLSDDGFGRPKPTPIYGEEHICRQIVSCTQLQSLSISLPSICADIFSDTAVKWSGDVQIRAASLCGNGGTLNHSVAAQEQFWQILNLSRALMEARKRDDIVLNIEIFINQWIFEPSHLLVHGDFQLGEILSDSTWPDIKRSSTKGPYGQTGLYGKDQGPYSCVSEGSFRDGLNRGYISF